MRTLIALILFATFALKAHAAEPPANSPAPAAEKPVTPAPSASPTESAADAAGAEQTAEKAADKENNEKAAAEQKASPQRFIPSEQVRADFDVSFPVDI